MHATGQDIVAQEAIKKQKRLEERWVGGINLASSVRDQKGRAAETKHLRHAVCSDRSKSKIHKDKTRQPKKASSLINKWRLLLQACSDGPEVASLAPGCEMNNHKIELRAECMQAWTEWMR